ncbi:MAG: Gfo/Idh/MocA family oxidoreductase [Chlorobiales bacterium]|nr:Gfo/Idh/MocA family oxidoreductase [Chlorobiales bacterium]
MRLAIVGVGKLGEFHTKLIQEISKERADVELAGVFDLNENRAREIASTYNTEVLPSLESVAERADAAVIATTTSTHHEIAKYFLSHHVDLFIEKPITNTVSQADDLIQLEKEFQRKIQVGHIERFNPALRTVESYIGNPLYITAERLSGFSKRVTDVSVILDLMIHDIDLILSLVKSDVIRISASGISVFSKELDMATARLEFKNGAVANVSASRISRTKSRKMRFFCQNPNSYASLDLTTGKSEVFRIVDKPTQRKSTLKEFATQKIIELFGDIQEALGDQTIEYISPEVPKTNALKTELESFIDSLLFGKPIAVTSTEGRQAVDVATRITEEISAHQSLIQTPGQKVIG